MTTLKLDTYEQSALADVAAQIKDHLGMDEEEAVEFLKFVFIAIGDSIRAQITSGKAPF